MNQQRISASSYSNTAPLIWSFQFGSRRGTAELILDTAPARSAELLASGRVNAALVPVIAYQTIPDVRLVPDVCVGARERVRSVCLVTNGGDLKDVKSVSLDISSRSSVALTKIIFREFLGIDPIFRPSEPDLSKMLVESDCALLIGDPALGISDLGTGIEDLKDSQIPNQRSQMTSFDLVEIWREFTGLGFVFAMWMTPGKSVEVDFAGARDEGLRHIDEIIANYESEIPLGKDEFRRYLTSNIAYSVDDSMRAGLELFFDLARRQKLIEKVRPLKFADRIS